MLTSASIILEDHTINNKIAEFALKTYQEFVTGKTTLVIKNQDEPVIDIFVKLIADSDYNMSLLIFSVDRNEIYSNNYDNNNAELTVIFLDINEIENLKEYLTRLSKLPGFYIFSKFLLVFKKKPLDFTLIGKTFEIVWSFKILRAFIIFWDDKVKVYNFNPFLKEFSRDITDSDDEKKKFYLEFELFDLYGYPMTVFLWDTSAYEDRVQEKINDDGSIEYLGMSKIFFMAQICQNFHLTIN